MRTLWDLLASFAQIGFFSIGGGYATIPLIQERVVAQAGWLTLQEFADIITISQMTPGPLAVNTSTFVGIRLAGVPGAVAATLACVSSGFAISILLYRLVGRCRGNPVMEGVLAALKAGSVGLIGAAGASILLLALGSAGTAGRFPAGAVNIPAAVLFCLCVLALRRFKTNPMLILAAAGAAGLLLYR